MAESLATTKDPANQHAHTDAAATADPHGAGAHPTDSAMERDHAALLALVPTAEATNIAAANGSWFDSATWQSGSIPGPNARVVIPAGMTVIYDGISDAPLAFVRIDGALVFAPDTSSRMVIDTLVVAPEGQLEIGTAANPVKPESKIEILIHGQGDIDTVRDPMLFSRGVISLGAVKIFGARKTAFLKVADAPMQGDGEITLAAIPEGWNVGDRLVVTGTKRRGWAWNDDAQAHVNHPSQDEVVTITALNGQSVTIDHPLLFNHDTPRADLKAYVANTSRNVVFESLAAEQTPLAQRGHVMLMHSDDVDVRYAAFNHLGRTDKADNSVNVADLSAVSPDSNIKGRYPLHLHRAGLADQGKPLMVVGNVVVDSPGWGFVHHSTNADMIDNVAFDVFGAAFVAEDGDETGLWLRNIAIRSPGFARGEDAVKQGAQGHDNGRTGDGFFFAGRLVEAAENVAANTTNGFVWMSRSAPSGPTRQTLPQPEIAYGKPLVAPEVPPIVGFRDNEAFGTETGLMVIKANPAQGHGVRSVLDGFLNWETFTGVNISYSGHYTLLNLDLIGTAARGYFAPKAGITFGTNTFDIVMNGLQLEGFPVGVSIIQGFTFPIADAELGFALIDVTASAVPLLIDSPSDARYRLLTSADLLDGAATADLRPLSIRSNEDLPLAMDTTDKLGRSPRQQPGDPQTIYRWEVPDLLRVTGYFTTPDQRPVALVPDFITDRATGVLFKQAIPVTLDISETELQGWGAVHHGTYDPDDQPPITRPDTVTTPADTPVIIAPLANDSDSEGATLSIDGTTVPRHGQVVMTEDGQLMYRPHLGYAGPDQITYWAADGAGNFAPGTVDIVVTSP